MLYQKYLSVVSLAVIFLAADLRFSFVENIAVVISLTNFSINLMPPAPLPPAVAYICFHTRMNPFSDCKIKLTLLMISTSANGLLR